MKFPFRNYASWSYSTREFAENQRVSFNQVSQTVQNQGPIRLFLESKRTNIPKRRARMDRVPNQCSFEPLGSRLVLAPRPGNQRDLADTPTELTGLAQVHADQRLSETEKRSV